MTYKYFGKKIKEKREELRLTVVELSKNVGISTRNIKKLEKGNINVNRDDMLSVCKYLKIKNYEELLDSIELYKNSYSLFKIYRREHLINNIILLFGIMVILLSCLWLYINRTQDFILNGKSDNFSYNNLYFIKNRDRHCIAFGTFSINNVNINIDDIKRVSLKYNDETIIESNTFPAGILVEDIGYNELFTKDIIKNIDKWYYEVEYTVDETNYIVEKVYLKSKELS